MMPTAVKSEPNGATPSSTSKDVPSAQEANNDLTSAVDDLLETMRTKFTAASQEMTQRMDDMSRRLDQLEASMRKGEGEA